MAASIFSRHKVNDFKAWKKVYDGRVPAAKEEGLIAESVHRDPDDPNTVIVYHQFGDLSTTQEFVAAMNTEQFQSLLKEAGVKVETMELWIGEDV